jgi:hypothetical protein
MDRKLPFRWSGSNVATGWKAEVTHGNEIEGMIQVTVGATRGAVACRWFSYLRTGDAPNARGHIVRHAATRFIDALPALYPCLSLSYAMRSC